MRPRLGCLVSLALIGSSIMLSACDKKSGDDVTNVVQMNASDGTMNDMTVVESTTLDQAGGNAAENGSVTEPVENGM